MNIKKIISIVVVLVSLFINQSYASLTFDLGSVITGPKPSDAGTWLKADFSDVGSKIVTLTLTAPGLTGNEFVSMWGFNSAIAISQLDVIQTGTPAGEVITKMKDLNSFGLTFGFEFPPPGDGRFITGNSVTYTFTRKDGGALDSDNFNYKTDGGYYSVAHIQNIGNDSAKITAVPEPSTYLAGMFAMCPMLMMFLRKRIQ